MKLFKDIALAEFASKAFAAAGLDLGKAVKSGDINVLKNALAGAKPTAAAPVALQAKSPVASAVAPAPAKTLLDSEYRKLSASAKASFVQAGGKITTRYFQNAIRHLTP